MRQWQQLKVTLSDEEGVMIIKAHSSIHKEIDKLIGKETLTFDHLGWLGWELVTVCKDCYYYKRPIS